MANRNRGKLIGGFYPDQVSHELRILAACEGTTHAALIAEALDMLLSSRGLTPFVAKAHADMVAPGNARRGKHARVTSGAGEF